MYQENENQLKPPRIIQTIVEGFNLIATHPYLMLFPLLLDVFFWFGPFYRIKDLLSPTLEEMVQVISASMVDTDSVITLESIRSVWDELLSNFNLFSSLRTYPIGIPSLLASKGYTSNPLGNPILFEVGSSSNALNIIFICSFIGLLLGGLYYTLISHLVVNSDEQKTTSAFFKPIAQSFVLVLVLLLILVLLSFPVLCFLSSISVLLPTMGTIPLIILGVILIWVLLPFVFSPHGIFTKQLNAVKAISLSSKFVRISSMATSFFLIIAVSLSYGMDLLWTTPEPDSWLFLLGLIGHAFVSSGILAASFIYYRDGIKWMDEIVKLKPPTQASNGM